MRRMRWCLLLLLAACGPTPTGWPSGGPARLIAVEGSDSGLQRITVPEVELFRDATGRMVARPAIVQLGDARRYAVLLTVLRHAPNGPRVELVASDHGPLDYQPNDRLWSHCIDGCRRAETGAVTLSEAAFRAAAQTGLPILVAGAYQSYEGTLPADAFARVLAAADAARDGSTDLPQIKDRVILGAMPEQRDP